MPMSDRLTQTVWAAVHAIERSLKRTYPQRFPNIDAAKLFVQKLCDAAAFDYGLLTTYNLRTTDPHHTVGVVKDRVWFLVAVRAHNQGKFYLDEALPDRQSLRDAIEADIPRISAFLQSLPPTLASADVAAKYLAGIAALRKFEYTRLEGLSEGKFRAYVTWNTARRAWERFSFELDRVPKEWKRRAPKTKAEKPKTMTDAIESDIARLSTLIPRSAWLTTFTDLDAARNFVGQWCYDNKSKYTGWPDVELRKYRLFVNFNAAKYAFEAGALEVERAVPPLNKAVKEAAVIPKDKMEVIEMKAPAVEKIVSAAVFGLATRADDSDDWYHGYGTSNTSASLSASTSLSSDTTHAEGALRTSANMYPEKEDAARIDRFKANLIAELQRGYILKVAFE